MDKSYRGLWCLIVFAVLTAEANFFEIKKSDVEDMEVKAKEVIARAKKLMTNPLFLSMLGCIAYVGPQSLIKEHPLLSVMGMGLMLTYLKGDNILVDIEGAEISLKLIKKKGPEKSQ